jgi:hypothetical protein
MNPYLRPNIIGIALLSALLGAALTRWLFPRPQPPSLRPAYLSAALPALGSGRCALVNATIHRQLAFLKRVDAIFEAGYASTLAHHYGGSAHNVDPWDYANNI